MMSGKSTDSINGMMSFALKRCLTTPYVLLVVLLFAGCGFKSEVLISGKTMGTIYHITVVTSAWTDVSKLQDKINKRLDEINQSMSTYIKDSEINRFNSMTSLTEKFYVSNDFMNVIRVAVQIYKLSAGAWDGTIKPLVDRWGFGSKGELEKIPSEKEIKTLLSDIGFDYLEISEAGYLKKKKPQLSLDFASIAKGYAVDQIAALIKANGVDNFLVEIGGEVYASGNKKNGNSWKIGINQPTKSASLNQVYQVVSLRNQALATSGDYRNFFEIDGKYYSHIIDPRTGFPADNGVVSVSIRAGSCTFADGLATAVMVMGHEKGLELVNRLDNIECMIVLRRKDATLVDYYSKGFKI